jgi:hypothetical protein
VKRLLLVLGLAVMLVLIVSVPVLATQPHQPQERAESMVAACEYNGWSGWDFLVFGDVHIDGVRDTVGVFGQINDNISFNYLRFWAVDLEGVSVSFNCATISVPVYVQGTMYDNSVTVDTTATLTATFTGKGSLFYGTPAWSFFYPPTGSCDLSIAGFATVEFRDADVSWSLIGPQGSGILYVYSSAQYPDDVKAILAHRGSFPKFRHLSLGVRF